MLRLFSIMPVTRGVTTYVTWDAHQTIQDSKDFIEASLANQVKTPLCPLGITLKDNPDMVIGTVGMKQGAHKFEADLSYVLGRKYWRQGLMYEAAFALMRMGFDDLGYKRIYAWCIKENDASSSLMKKLGMQFEGRFRDHAYRHGRLWDMDYYGILLDEWKKQIQS